METQWKLCLIWAFPNNEEGSKEGGKSALAASSLLSDIVW